MSYPLAKRAFAFAEEDVSWPVTRWLYASISSRSQLVFFALSHGAPSWARSLC